jgi:von Willebrand factor type D domain/C8 domain
MYTVCRLVDEILQNYYFFEEKVGHAWGVVSMAWNNVSQQVYSHPPIAYILSVGTIWRDTCQRLVSHFIDNGQLHQILSSVLSRMDMTTATAIRLVDAVVNRRALFTYSLDMRPELGYFSYSQVLPIHWHRFQDTPQLLELFNWGERTSQQVDVTKLYLDMHDVIRSVMGVVATRTFLPPFSATAMLIGDNQIMTFDRNFYTLKGGCSYLMTSDFAHNRFAVVANYKGEQREYLRVIQDKQTIDIHRDGRVSVNNSRVDLPVMYSHNYIRQEGRRIILHSKQGLLVDYNIVQNIFTIKLSGWYFGRTGGLLGVYDNEPSNDWMTSERQIVTSIESFAQSWQVDSCAEAHPIVDMSLTEPTLNLTDWDREKCADFFRDPENSLLLPCMATVDPEPYQQLCLQQLTAQRQGALGMQSVEAAFCLVVAAYTEDCRWNGVEISLPGECVTCTAPHHTPLRGGETVSYQGNAPRSADVVFVVEEDPCLQQLRFRSIVPLIESSLVEAGMLGNQYALVGFGGRFELGDPHTFTSASKEFNDAKGILQAFSR